jgi:ubiquinone/menaquinone biosynthesis C-methylase UbiE
MNRFHRWYCRSAIWKTALNTGIMPYALDGLELGPKLLEVGPGPGLTTDVLRQRAAQITAIEVDPHLAAALEQRLQGTNVTVIKGDATAMPFQDQMFSGAVSFTMLHHVPSPALQDQLFAEVFRVLKPGGPIAGTDSRSSLLFRLIHFGDTMVLVDPATLGQRLEQVGFTDVAVDAVARRFRFRARRPLS